MSNLSAEVLLLLYEYETNLSAIGERSLSDVAEDRAESPSISVFITFENDLNPLLALGFNLLTQAGNIAVGTIAFNKLRALAVHPNVLKIERPDSPEIGLDDSIPHIRANQVWARSGDDFTGFSGNGVVVGIIDTGCDYTHRSFRKADGSTRILRIWDQTINPANGSSETSPATLNHATLGQAIVSPYGVEYKDQDSNNTIPTIARALADIENSFSIVRHRDTDGHGTHVAGTAAGNGKQNGNCHGEYHYIGVAPEADLIIVRLRGLTQGDPPTTGSETIDAIRYIIDRAGSKPVAINLSIYSNIGPRDGTGGGEVAIDAILNAFGQKVAIVFITGNENDDKRHATASVAPNNGTFDLGFSIPAGNNSPVEIDVRYTGGPLQAALQAPNTPISGFASIGTPVTVNPTAGGSVTVGVSNSTIRISFTPPSSGTPPVNGNNAPGNWILRLRNPTASAVSFHAWSTQKKGPGFANNVSTDSTLSRQSTGRNIIAVGAHIINGKSSGERAPFSDKGPALFSFDPADPFAAIRPHLTAPGVDITAPAIAKYRSDGDDCCKCCCCVDYYRDDQGTSMAAPHVTGAIALMFEKNANQSFTTIRNILTASSVRDAHTTNAPTNNFGFGKLDVKAAVEMVTAVSATPSNMPVVVAQPSETRTGNIQDALAPTGVLGKFAETEAGQMLYDLGKQHFEEVRTLINTNKRVATVWHRNNGPWLGHQAIRCVMIPDVVFPSEFAGTSVVARVERFAEILHRYGSKELKASLDLVLPIAVQLPGKSLTEATHFLQEENPSAYA